MFKLVIQDDEGKTTVVPLIRDEITIGRKEGNTIRLTERNVSRRHARILRNNGEVHIEDLGSYNGIRVNNARIAERVSLRVSDQVQIGDYKLYLKAEGVEQVDDARTMPIERIGDNGAAPTEVIPAIAAPAVTAQVAAVAAPPASTPVPPPQPAPAPAPPQLIGNPARTMVAISGDDASGRPIATAAVVAALTQPVGHGKLVVLSSNFAGKEFELTRGQMIIGRTDENDIVINHRSISRNHAKIVREPDTQKYTISDLQSSNGVRVNGQDYSKVELRRGDVVDLGHVRLRFIEPGEDFVFARDAVITDVPESGGKRGLLVAVVLGVVVLGAAAAFLVMHNAGEHGDQPAQNGADGSAQTHVVLPTDTLDAHAAELSADAAIAQIETPDASTGLTPNHPADDREGIALRCKELGTNNKQWDRVITCANKELKPLDAPAAKLLVDGANSEKRASEAAAKVTEELANKNLAGARGSLATIPTESVYYHDAQTAVDAAKTVFAIAVRKEVDSYVNTKNCAGLRNYLVDTVKKQLGPDGGDPYKGALAQVCTPPAISENPERHPQPGLGSGGMSQPGQGSSSAVVTPMTTCDAEEHKRLGEQLHAKTSPAQALVEFELSLRCRRDPHVISLAYMAACESGNLPKAKQYYVQMPATGAYSQATLLQMCVRNNLDPRPKSP